MNVKVLNLVVGINEKISLIQHECVRINPKQKWNHGQCQYKSHELDD